MRLAADVTLTPEPCIAGEEIDARLALRSGSLERPVVFLDGVEVGLLLADVTAGLAWQDLLAGWARLLPRPQAERLAAWCWEKRVLCAARL